MSIFQLLSGTVDTDVDIDYDEIIDVPVDIGPSFSFCLELLILMMIMINHVEILDVTVHIVILASIWNALKTAASAMGLEHHGWHDLGKLVCTRKA